jgi:hypothetical protein
MSAPQLNSAIQGQGTISADNLNTYLQGAQMASQLRDFTGLPGMTVVLQGITVPNDGFGGAFYWNPAGTEPDDNLNYIVPEGTGTGEWVRFTVVAGGAAGFVVLTTSSSVTAAGTTQATSTNLISQINNVTTVPSGSGVELPSVNMASQPLSIGTQIQVFNRGGGNLLSVYPPVGSKIETLSTNAPSGISNNGDATFTLITPTLWLVS